MDTLKRAQKYADFYKKLQQSTPKSAYEEFFDENTSFEDPFQKVQGFEPIHEIFLSMYEKLYNPKFEILEVVCSADVAYIRWSFHYALSKNAEEQSFVGVSRVSFQKNGKVATHIDYWDAATHVYEKIPLIGSLIRLIKRKLHA